MDRNPRVIPSLYFYISAMRITLLEGKLAISAKHPNQIIPSYVIFLHPEEEIPTATRENLLLLY